MAGTLCLILSNRELLQCPLHRRSTSPASAGDVNGDGFADLIIGGTQRNPTGEPSKSNGVSHVVFGKPSGWNSSLNLSTLDGSNGFRLNGVSADDNMGYSVASAGDVNGDGFADIIIGARQADPNGRSSAYRAAVAT